MLRFINRALFLRLTFEKKCFALQKYKLDTVEVFIYKSFFKLRNNLHIVKCKNLNESLDL